MRRTRRLVLAGLLPLLALLAIAALWQRAAERREARRFPPPGRLVDIGGLTAEWFARRHPSDVVGMVWVDALAAQVVRSVPEVSRLSTSACAARTAAWFGLIRLVDPLDLRSLPPPEKARAMALTYRTSTLATACSLTESFATSAGEIELLPALPAKLPLVVLTHDDPAGIMPGIGPDELAEFEPRWQAAQRSFAASVARGEVRSVHSRHLIASGHPEFVIDAVRRLRALLSTDSAAPSRAPGL